MDNLDKQFDPSNISLERAFGTLKSIEARFQTLGMSHLLQSCIAKYNGLHNFISEASDEIIIEAHK